ncbi:MAG: hypothetical protein ACYSWP_09485, partial [Planctomycetota bacterium]
MSIDYSPEVCRALEQKFADAQLHRPMRVGRYEEGTELFYEVSSVSPGSTCEKIGVRLVVEKFVGGGFAGQVYKVRVQDVGDQGCADLEVGKVYAIKILIPPSSFSRIFRDVLYWIGFQGPFGLQVNPVAARSSALWQKFIRRAAGINLGNENAVVDVHGTFVDHNLGSCGEISEWIDGRTWQLEVDDRMDLLKKWSRGKVVDHAKLGSDEFRAKKQFMADFVKLLHD